MIATATAVTPDHCRHHFDPQITLDVREMVPCCDDCRAFLADRLRVSATIAPRTSIASRNRLVFATMKE